MDRSVMAATAWSQREGRRAEPKGVGLESLIHTDLTQTGGPKNDQERQQPQRGSELKLKRKPMPKPAMTPTPTLKMTTTPTAVTTSVLTQTRRWGTVPPSNQKTQDNPAPAPTTGSSLADRCLMPGRDENMPLPNKMDQQIASAINRALFPQQGPARIWIINARRNAKDAIRAITHRNPTGGIALQYRDFCFMPVRTVEKVVIDVEENESCERRKIHAVPLVQ